MESLRTELQSDAGQLDEMKKKIESQQSVIDRFSDQVTNADVMRNVASLKQELEDSVEQMEERLNTTETSIASLLNKTVQELDDTVT